MAGAGACLQLYSRTWITTVGVVDVDKRAVLFQSTYPQTSERRWIMREQLLKWSEKRRADLTSIGITTSEFHMGPDDRPKPGAFVDHDTLTALGRITIWESGEMEVEAIHIEDGKQIFWKYYQLDGEPNFDLLLQDYFDALTKANV